jgi:hypothetical protein
MWEPRRLTTLWASTACYTDSFYMFRPDLALRWGRFTFTTSRVHCSHLPKRDTSSLLLPDGSIRTKIYIYEKTQWSYTSTLSVCQKCVFQSDVTLHLASYAVVIVTWTTPVDLSSVCPLLILYLLLSLIHYAVA